MLTSQWVYDIFKICTNARQTYYLFSSLNPTTIINAHTVHITSVSNTLLHRTKNKINMKRKLRALRKVLKCTLANKLVYLFKWNGTKKCPRAFAINSCAIIIIIILVKHNQLCTFWRWRRRSLWVSEIDHHRHSREVLTVYFGVHSLST